MADRNQPEEFQRLADECLAEFESRSGTRGTWESHWQEIADFVDPMFVQTFRHGDFASPGERKTDRQLDSTPTVALGRFAATMDSFLTPRNQTWHRLSASNAALMRDYSVRRYFDDVTRLLFRLRYAPKANFSAQNQLVYRGLGAWGSSAMYIDDMPGETGFRYRSIPVGDMYWKENHQGIVDDVIRRFDRTPKQLVSVEKWRAALPDKVKKLAEKPGPNNQQFGTKFTILHWVWPRDDYNPDALDERGLRFKSVYVIKQTGTVLEIGGYNSFPYAPTRYEQAPNEVYGRSPAMQVLPAIKTLNAQKRVTLKQGHRAADPIILVHDDGLMENVSLRPGHMVAGGVSADGRPLVQPMPSGNYQIAKDMMDEERRVVNDAFLVTLFQILVETPRMTATEVIERATEKGILLAPTVGRQQSEYLGPMIEREIDLAYRAGLLPEMPPALLEAEGDYEIVYDSPLSKLARAEEAAGFSRTLQIMIPAIQLTGDPSPLDNLDLDVALRELSDTQAVPTGWLRDPKAVAAIREARAQQMAQQQAVQAAPAQAAMMQAEAAQTRANKA